MRRGLAVFRYNCGMKKAAAPKKAKARKKKSASAPESASAVVSGERPRIPDGHFILLGDCLDAMAELRDEHGFREQVDLVYLDPPFNSKSEYSFIFGEENATKSSVVAFTDSWDWKSAAPAYEEYVRGGAIGAKFLRGMRDMLGTSRRGRAMLSYLTAMTPRLELMRELLKPSGSIYLHCDHSAGHYLKIAMDAIFGAENFRNEIVWCYGSPGRPGKWFPRKHDTILFYAKGPRSVFNPDAVLVPHKRVDQRTVQEGWRRNKPAKFSPEKAKELAQGKMPFSWWDDIAPAYKSARQFMGYPTQKPLELLKRVILASSNKGDLVMDPYCGCGTTLAACVETGRDFAGVDIEPFAAKTIKARMAGQYLMDVRIGHVQPKTEEDFIRLVEDRRYREFQFHAISLIRGAFPNPKHSGDKGVDGWVFVRRQNQPKNEAIVISVKAGGQLSPAMVRELAGVLSLRTPRPLAGILITMGEPTEGMVTAAEEAGHYQDGKERIPRIQILPIKRLMEGRCQMPGIVDVKGLAGEFRGLYAGL